MLGRRMEGNSRLWRRLHPVSSRGASHRLSNSGLEFERAGRASLNHRRASSASAAPPQCRLAHYQHGQSLRDDNAVMAPDEDENSDETADELEGR